MLSVRRLTGWADAWARASHEKALANARGAAREASAARVERAEVEAYLASVTRPIGAQAATAHSGGR